ncbi:MAG: hypothetical protein AB7E42_03640 [Anaerotignaceae bacterium]
MVEDITVEDFIKSQTTVDFILRRSEYLDVFLAEHPEIVTTKTLGGRYIIGYVDRANVNYLSEVLGSSFVSSLSIVLGLLDRSSLEASGITQVQQQPYFSVSI